MYKTKRIIGVIPARGGSKGIPMKNSKLLQDRPLIDWSINAASKSQLLDRFIVSTDSTEIAYIALNTGAEVPFRRPEALATDTATTRDVLIHAINFLEENGDQYDYLVLLQPTSPFRRKGAIDEAIQLAINEKDVDMVVSVKETSSNPYYVLFEEDQQGYLKSSKEGYFQRRQDCPKVYEYNGSIYVIRVSSLRNHPTMKFPKILKYLMSDEESIDLDTEFDWKFAEFLASQKDFINELL